MAAEALTPERLDELAAWIESHTDLDTLLDLATQRAPALRLPPVESSSLTPTRVRIAVARDAAFCFYYRDNLDLLRASGAELVEFSPIADGALPADIGGLYLGGGYPELHAARLSANQSMLESIRRFAAAGHPVYAECGGFMYLTEAIIDTNGHEHLMAGIFPTRARMKPRLAALGYLEVEAPSDSLWLRAGERLRGHEFRHSEIDPMPPAIRRCFQLTNGREARTEGYSTASVLAGYTHLHFTSAPQFARRFVEACQDR
jgi:cobyrinic acid a,c-diamide synthase